MQRKSRTTPTPASSSEPAEKQDRVVALVAAELEARSAWFTAVLRAHKEDIARMLDVNAKNSDDGERRLTSWMRELCAKLDRLAVPLAGVSMELVSAIHREVACVRSDTLALLAMREADGRRFSRVEGQIDLLVEGQRAPLPAAETDPATKKRNKKAKRKAGAD